MGWLDDIVTERYAQLIQTARIGAGESAVSSVAASSGQALQSPDVAMVQSWPMSLNAPSRMPGFYLGNTFIPIWIPLAGLALLLLLRKR